MPDQQAIENVTEGLYHRVQTSHATWVLATNTDTEATEMAAAILANGANEYFPWIRFEVTVWDSSAVFGGEVFVIKCLSTDAIQDLDDEEVLRSLQEEGKLFYRKKIWSTPYAGARSASKTLWKVKLKDGEELRMVIHPILGATVTIVATDLEYRQTGA